MADPKNTLYQNFVLENEIEQLVASKLDLQQFVTVDNALVGAPGMQIKVNVYNATDATQELGIGEGNTESIIASYTQKPYEIKLAQNRFEYYDEEAMTDPIAIQTGIQKQAAGLYDKMNADIYGEWAKGTRTVTGLSTDPFAAFVDGQALINTESLEPGQGTFAVIHPKDLANFRKKLGDNLKYVESFAREGYVGHVAGTPVYVKQNATEKTVYLATPLAVKLFVKTGTEVEVVGKGNRSEIAGNIRLNTQFARKYYVCALVDDTQVVALKDA